MGSALLINEQDIIYIAEILKSDGNVTTAEYRKLLVAGKYCGTKSTIKQPSQDIEILRNEVAPLEAKKHENPTMNNQKTLVYLKQDADFLDLETLEHKVPSEFVPLIRAARGLPINISEFKMAVRKAIKVVMPAKLNGTNKTTET
jgi:hypothetical protein